ncbi:hypothetical protein CHS0354_034135 [Potamilus streckersoni]|uniref:Aquaporin n=1 Tax=Potamilus streckersoni TaxID=2493646 RepID=A0AAE0TD32_9BIVA|nr:hypothetical protein CHS0354_034135 [Potamilus streckersoni]
MERPFSSRIAIRSQLSREALAEFLGTFVVLVFGTASVAQSVLSSANLGTSLSIHFSWGIGVMMGVYVSGGVSGGHLNPAVTLALSCLGRFPWKKVPVYMLAQYLGSFVASACVYLVYMDALNNFDGGKRLVDGEKATAGIWSTYPQSYVSTYNAFGDQIFGTAMLLVCVLAITDERNMNPPKGLVPVIIGLLVIAIGMTLGLNCGYPINPARDLAPRIFTAIAGWGDAPFKFRDYNWFWVPIVGPLLGAILGAFLYQLCVGFHWPKEEILETKYHYNGPLNADEEKPGIVCRTVCHQPISMEPTVKL